MADNVTPLKPATAGAAPSAPPVAPDVPMLIGILTELSLLKEAAAAQAELNASLNAWITAQQTINAGLMGRLDALASVARGLVVKIDGPAATGASTH